MAIRIEHVGDVAIVIAGGRLIRDAAGIESSDSSARTEAEDVHAKLGELLDSGQKKILLNLEKVTALDSNALKFLTRFQVAAGRRDSHFRMCGLSEDISGDLCYMCLGTLGNLEHPTRRRVTFEAALKALQEV